MVTIEAGAVLFWLGCPIMFSETELEGIGMACYCKKLRSLLMNDR